MSEEEEEAPSTQLLQQRPPLQERGTPWGKAARLGGFIAGELSSLCGSELCQSMSLYQLMQRRKKKLLSSAEQTQNPHLS